MRKELCGMSYYRVFGGNLISLRARNIVNLAYSGLGSAVVLWPQINLPKTRERRPIIVSCLMYLNADYFSSLNGNWIAKAETKERMCVRFDFSSRFTDLLRFPSACWAFAASISKNKRITQKWWSTQRPSQRFTKTAYLRTIVVLTDDPERSLKRCQCP